MKKTIGVLLFGILAVAVVIGAIAALIPVSGRIGAFQRQLPLPVACVGLFCVSYRDLAADLDRSPDAAPIDILSRRLEERAFSLVAFRQGIRVSESDISRAVGGAREAVLSVPEGNAVVRDLYGVTWEASLASAFETLLLREKLQAEGISSPWSATPAPTVTVWNVHLRWDSTTHQIVGTSSVAGDANVR